MPVDADGVARFHHLPAGSPDLRVGGLEPTRPLPSAVSSPIARAGEGAQDGATRCAVLADVQTCGGRELGCAREVPEDGFVVLAVRASRRAGRGPRA